MDNFNEQLNDWKLRRKIHRLLDPSKNTTENVRERFLYQLNGGRLPIHQHVIKWRYALITALIAVFSTVGIATYADQTNVPATHPLYQFKRWGEDLRLGLSTPQQQVQLRQEFANRRIHEIEEVRAASVSQGPVIEQNLEDDFQSEANTVVDQAQQLNLQTDQRRILCQNLLDSVDHAIQNPRRLEHIHQHCDSIMGGAGKNQSGGSSGGDHGDQGGGHGMDGGDQ